VGGDDPIASKKRSSPTPLLSAKRPDGLVGTAVAPRRFVKISLKTRAAIGVRDRSAQLPTRGDSERHGARFTYESKASFVSEADVYRLLRAKD
jgi:hypothetical protein